MPSKKQRSKKNKTKLTNDMKDTINYVEGRIPLMGRLLDGNPDDHRKILYSVCKMEEIKDYYRYDNVFTRPITGGQIFTLTKNNKPVEKYIWLLKDQDNITEPKFHPTTIDEDGNITHIGEVRIQ